MIKKLWMFLLVGLMFHFPIQPVPTMANFINPEAIKFIGTTTTHNVIVTNTNEVFAWGSASNGNLGDGVETNAELRFARVSTSGALANRPLSDNIIQLVVAPFGFALLTESGTIYATGNNASGVLGTGDTNHAFSPIVIDQGALATLDQDEKVIQLAGNYGTGAATLHALTSKGKIIGWGANFFYGAVGDGSTGNILTPTDITTNGDFSLLQENEMVIDLVNTVSTLIALTNQGRLFAWGFNYNNSYLPLDPVANVASLTPKLLNSQAGAFQSMQANGDQIVKLHPLYFSVALSTLQGDIYYFGVIAATSFSQPVLLTNFQNFPALNEEETIRNVFGTTEGFFALTSEARIFGYGRNNGFGSAGIGSLGTGNTTRYNTPTEITTNGALADLDPTDEIIMISSLNSTFAISKQGRLFVWGDNNYGQYLLDTTITAINTPVEVTALYSEKVIDEIFTPASLVEAKIAYLPVTNDITLDDADAIAGIRASYDALTPEEQALVSNYQTLLDAEAKLAQLNQAALDQASADEVIALIQALVDVENLTLADADAIAAARDAFNALNPQAQAFVTNLDKLLDLDEALLALFGAIDDVINMIEAFPSLNAMTLADETDVIAARQAYDALSEEQQALVTNYADLQAAEARIEELKAIAAANQAAADEVIDQIDALPSVAELTLDDEADVLAAVTAYEALTADQKLLVTNYAKLQALVAQLEVLNQPSGSFNFLWLLLLLIPLAFAGYSYRRQWLPLLIKRRESKPVETTTMKVEETVQSIQLDEVKLANVKTRPQFQAFSKVSAGSYLEITPDFASTNRVVDVQDTLPKSLNESNRFIALSKEEVQTVKLSLTSGAAFIKKTPGSYIDQEGYYVEVDINNHLVDNYIFAKTRLAPTTTKGHRWIKIETRKIQD